MAKPRMLLDTNVWRYVADARREDALIRFAKDGRWHVQIAPAVVFETLRFNDVALMRTIVGVQTKPQFHRLMPEAFSEAQEILTAIRSLRPGWLRDVPHLETVAALRDEWSRKGFWRRCQRSPSGEAAWLRDREGNLAEAAHADVKARREEMLKGGWKHRPSMDKVLAMPISPIPGWKGDWVEAWRVERLEEITRSLTERGNPRRDWLGPYLPLEGELLFSKGWNEFWLYEAQSTDLPRQWLRWAHKFQQRFRKVSPGSSGDTQLFSYLLETDLVVSADKGLIDILDECRPYAPRSMPAAKLIHSGLPGVKELLELLVAEPTLAAPIRSSQENS